MRKAGEFAAKLERVENFLSTHELAGVALKRAENFAWLGCGADNVVDTSVETGAATLVVRSGCVTLISSNIEADRLLSEELDELDITEVQVYPWHEPERREAMLRSLSRGARFVADDGAAGLQSPPAEFDRLRYRLTGAEVERYQALGEDATAALEEAARTVEQGMTEADAAGLAARELHARGLTPIVLLVAADERTKDWRHPLPRANPIEQCALLVVCGRRQGLVAALSRMVHFGEPSPELRERHRAVCAVDAAMILSTMPETNVADVLDAARRAYEDADVPNEWQLHHQGGAIGYRSREYVVTPDSSQRVLPVQAFAWNPSITGTKSEDTILAGEEGVAFLTAPSDDWPVVRVEFEGQEIDRPGILIR
jgi:antitoxin VapB